MFPVSNFTVSYCVHERCCIHRRHSLRTCTVQLNDVELHTNVVTVKHTLRSGSQTAIHSFQKLPAVLHSSELFVLGLDLFSKSDTWNTDRLALTQPLIHLRTKGQIISSRKSKTHRHIFLSNVATNAPLPRSALASTWAIIGVVNKAGDEVGGNGDDEGVGDDRQDADALQGTNTQSGPL